MTEKSEVWKKYSIDICLAGLFVTAFLLRVYRIGELPDILQIDEAGIGHNAWNLANYGVDRYLNEMPIYPQNYNGGQSPLYTYCLVLLLKLFPAAHLTPGLVRLPALFSSMLVVVCGAKLLRMLFDDGRVVLAGTALLTFCPYFIMSGRFALDCNMMLGCGMLAITLLVRYLQKPTWSALLLCGAGFALTLYSYALSYIILPIFLAAIVLYMIYTKKISVGRTFVWACEIAVLALPLILFVICLLAGLPGFRFLGFHILPIAAERMEDLGQTEFWSDFLDCVRITLTNGSYMLDAVDKYYTMYVISIPFIAIGFVWAFADFLKSFRNRRFTYSAIFVLYALAIVTVIGMAGSGYVYRANAIFVCYLYFCIVGIREMLRFLNRYRRAFAAVLCLGYAFWTAVFLRYYFTMYSVADTYTYPNSLYFCPEREALVRVAETSEERNVYIDSFFEEYYYFYYPVSPWEKEERDGVDKPGREREFCMNVDYNTPVETDSVYMVRKENREFIGKLQSAGLPYETEEFVYYYVFTIPGVSVSE